MDNLKIQMFRGELANTINGSDLPVEVRRMVVSEFLAELTATSLKVTQEEFEAFQKEQESKEKQITEEVINNGI